MDVSNTHLLDEAVVTTTIDAVVDWGREASLWPFVFGTACCAIEFMSTAASRYDISRFGAEVLRFSPRHADLLIVAGTVSYKQAPILKQIYDQMPEPKWVIAVGACASTGGFYDNYTTLQGIDEIIPVDIYVAGCPPRPEAILDSVMDIQKQLKHEEKFAVRNTDFKGKLDDI
ncbi:NADH-quinone oxidoreductase subunit B [Sulfurimonas sp.]|jgi:NADH-quinone oxidoreductase subunit B|uniref:NADH-quinone oxidoreductase subunit B n=1 Tax=Sulfurimonas sp. TaxID=2022749 RepID=UPI0025DB7E0C|nr:NADH-quinone oxidoreductase subunit NuoB [Sulfurimonas sp.]MBT5934218.1 NADH-quinone oxidoreductase subunit NuoB [Sulfurimonas sp.]